MARGRERERERSCEGEMARETEEPSQVRDGGGGESASILTQRKGGRAVPHEG